ncbi:MAG: hypothetical protein RDV48_19110 [Candidatus Eremiobacteraeota bacterium]|nr:hypothetical protein [Candidatus Eremiobacteraeota bacterium]
MRKTAAALFILLALIAFGQWSIPAFAAGDDTVEFKGTIGEELNKIDVDQLVDKVSQVLEKYKCSDDDVALLTDTTEDFIKSVNDYLKHLKAADPDKFVVAPHDALREFCLKLESFLKKYNVTVEDTLLVGGSLTDVAMSMKEDAGAQGDTAGEGAKNIASKEEVDGVFNLLLEFSKKHKIMAADLVPVIYRISDIGLTFVQNKVSMKKLKEAGGRWRKRLYDLGVSKEQADGLYDSLVAFIYKYHISLREIVRLNKQINKALKAGKEEQKQLEQQKQQQEQQEQQKKPEEQKQS